MGFLLALFLGFVPMLFFATIIYWLDHYEKEPKFLLGAVFIWGAIVAAGGAFFINTVLGLGVYLFSGSEAAAELTTSSLIAPIIEESLKGFAVLMIFLFFRHEFDSYLDGIVYAAVAALGFAATENVYYIYTYGFNEGGYPGLAELAFVRIILVGWQHPFYTAFIGIGVAASRLSLNPLIKVLAPVMGWLFAVFSHAMHNTLASFLNGAAGIIFGTALDWTGWTFMLLFIIWAIYREQTWIATQLREEVTMGLITPHQYRTACSAWYRSAARLGALFSGRYLATHRFYQTCAELAYKKHQRLSLGEERGIATIERLRADLARLSSQAAV